MLSVFNYGIDRENNKEIKECNLINQSKLRLLNKDAERILKYEKIPMKPK
jgi:hypothetical protein